MEAPQPEHRQPPTYWAPPDDPGRLLAGWIAWPLLVFGFVLSAVLAWYSIGLIATAWAACDEADPPYLFGLLWVIFPATTLAAWVGFTIGAILTSRWHNVVRCTAGAALAAAICLQIVTLKVPVSDGYDDYYAQSTDPSMIECGAYGIPTWWPTWLPS